MGDRCLPSAHYILEEGKGLEEGRGSQKRRGAGDLDSCGSGSRIFAVMPLPLAGSWVFPPLMDHQWILGPCCLAVMCDSKG